MGWSIDEVRRRREQLNAGNAKQTTSSAGGATSAAARNVLEKNPYKDTAAAHTTAKTPTTAVQKTTGSTSGTAATRNVLEKNPYPGTGTTRATGGTGTGLTPAQVAQKRAQLTAGTTTGRLPTSVTTTQQPEWTNGTRKVLGTVTADELGKTMLAYVSTPTGSPVKTDRQEDYEPDWNYAGNDNTPKERAIAQGTYGSYVKAAQAAGKALSQDRQTDRFDELNQWMDESPRHRQLVSLMRQGKSGTEDAMALGSSTGDNAAAVREEYSPGELLKMGYTAEEINGARRYIREYDALPLKDRAARRTADTIKGIGATVAAAVPLTGEYAGQSAQNIYTTWQNETALDKELEGDARGKELKQLMTAVDMDYKPQYTDAQLREMGYSAQEISTMRARINGTVANEAVDKDMSLGYQLYHYGQQRTSAAQAGMNPTAQAAMGIATSAAENLAVAGVSPYLVLPVLSAQGAAESMGQSMERGDSAGTALATGLAKFGAGWAINSVGAADLAKTMGADYAKETVAGRIADFVRGLSGSSEFAKAYPVVANAISGGIDNAMQAFVETYADTAIDAVLGGDQESAEALLKPETFLQAVQSGLTGGASGALGGAVGTGLGKMNAELDARATEKTYKDPLRQTAAEDAPSSGAEAPPSPDRGKAVPEGKASAAAVQEEQARKVQQFVEEKTGAELPQPPADGSSLGEGALKVDNKNSPSVSGKAADNGDVRYSIQVDADGKNFVQIDKDILEGVPPEQWKGVVKDAIKEMFPDGFERDGNHIDNTREGRNEFVRSKSTMWLQHHEGETYADKMRMAQNLDELVQTSGNAVNEAANHKNAESFNRGKINVRVGTNDYRVDVLTAIKNDGREVFYDVVGIEPEKIKAPTRTAEGTSGSKSVGTDEDIRRSGAGNAESNDKSLPDASEEIAEALQAPMDAAESDPRHTSETFSAHSSADATVTQETGKVNGDTVEKAGESVESGPAEYADVELKADPAALKTDSWTRGEQLDTARTLARNARMSTQAVQTVVNNMPEGIGAEIYAPAAASLYRLGVNGEGASFDEALRMTGRGSALSGRVQQVLALGDAGRTALNLAYLQGKGEAERYQETRAAELGKRPGKAALREDAGTYYKADGSVSTGTRAEDALIELSAKASGVAAQRVVQGLKNHAKGLLQSTAGKVFYSGEADTATVMHETLHELNRWDNAGGQELIGRFEHYLVEQNGMDSVQELVQSYLDRYERAGQKLTYNQAMEEITADAMRSIFGTEESFRNFLRMEAAEAKRNAQAQGRCDRVMQKIETLLQKVLTDIKTLLGAEPDNAAAKAAQTLTETQLKDLRQLYFNHQADAGANYRAALEANGGMEKAAAADAAAAEDVRYSLPEMASETEEEKTKRQMALTIRPAEQNAERTAKVSGQEWSGMKIQEARKAILEVMKEFGIVNKYYTEKTLNVEYQYRTDTARKSANHQTEVSGREYNDLALIQANIEEVLEKAVPLEAHVDRKAKPHVEGIIVLASALQDGKRVIPVRAELKIFDNEPTSLYIAIAETTAKNSREAANKKRTGSEMEESVLKDTRQPSTGSIEETGSQPRGGAVSNADIATTGSSDINILDYYRLVNHDANFTKYFSDEVAQKAERLDELRADPARAEELGQAEARLQARADAIEDDKNYLLKHPRYQLDVDSEDVEAAKRQSVGDGGAETETLAKVMAQADAAQVSDESLERIARKMVKTSDSRADAKTLTSRLQALRNYLGGGDVDWAQAHGFVLDMAQQIMEGSAKKNDELWKAYPDLHKMGMSLQKGSKDYNEVLYKYGSWAEARKELARHGINLTLTKNGEVSRWDADFTELQKIGAGLLPDETPSSAADALEAMAAAHDAIRPTMESAYDSDWDAAKQELAMDIWNEYLGLPGVANRRNAKLRAEFKARTEQMNEQAKQHSLALQAQANLNAAKQRGTERQKMRQPYADRMTKAQQDYKEAAARAEAKLGAKERKLEQQAAVLREAERGKTREKIAIAQAKNAERLAQMRDSRDKDNTRRAIRKATSQLTKMFEHPKENQYVPEYLLDKVRPVLQLANEAIGNRDTARRLAQWAHRGEEGWTYEPMKNDQNAMEQAMNGLSRGVEREMKHSDLALLEWQNSGVEEAISDWLLDVNENRKREIARLNATIRNTEKWAGEYGGVDGTAMEAYLNALREERDHYQNGDMATLSSSELRGLRDIIDQTLHIIKIDNVVVGATEDVMIDEFAERAKAELTDAKGVSRKPGARGKVSRALNGYKMNTMNIERMFERLGGYTHGGAMENLGRMLNDGQRKKTKILIEGTRVFDELTGPKHEKELYHFTHDLIDIGLRDDSGKARKITHDQLAELALQLQNRQGVHHILNGGLTLENMEAKLSGDAGLAKLDKATVRVGQLAVTDEAGNKLDAAALSQNEDAERRTLLEEVDKHLTDYDRAWMAAWKTLNARMTGYINETSMLLSGVKKATTENYIHINVDQDTNPEQNKGIRYDNSAANPGFLNHRVNSSKPVLLVGLVQQAETSIENTAQYAGMAVPLRNVEKVLNSMQGGRTLFGTMEDVWGEPAREYMNKALADLCEVKDSREVGDGVFAKLRSYAASAALNANINVTLLQAASLPTAAAELGWGATGSAAVQFGKNLFDLRNVARFFGSDMDSSLTKIEQRMAEHGDELLAYRLRGTGVGEMASANVQKGLFGRTHDAARNSDNQTARGVTKAADKVISLWTGGITKMDEITVAACWQGSESYVKAHPEEFAAGAEVADSPEYWAAVNEKFQQVVEHTQPNYTTMQRTGFQRSGNAMTKTLMMFSTQRQQNAQILTAAFEDYAAQNEWVKAREKAYKDHPDAESKAALEEAQKAKDQAALRKMNAISSQVVQTAVIAALGVGVKFGLHRWQDLQDDNGDMTLWSVAADFVRQYIKSFGSNWTGVSEAMTAVDLVTSGLTSTRSTISMNGIEVANDIVRKIAKVYQLEAKDTSEMTEKQLDAYNAQMKEAIADMLGQFAAARGIPYANLKKQVQAVTGWMDTLANWNKEGGNFDSLPASATGQYDRLYNAYLNGDTAEAKAAMEKLDGMVEAGIIQENKMYDQMKQRLMQYEPRVTEAAQETNADRWEKRKQLVDQMTDEMKAAFGTNSTDVRDTVVKAVDAKSNELLKAEKGYDKSDSLYAGLRDAVGSGSSQSVQDEYDRLVKAGKKPSSVKNEITKAAKADYVDGSAYDREQMAEMLLRLKDADGKALYEQKTLDGWVKQAEKAAASAEDTADPYADLR